jgi:hypothetical protein
MTMVLMSQLTPQHLKLEIDLWWLPQGEQRKTVLDTAPLHLRTASTDQLRPAMKHATSTR